MQRGVSIKVFGKVQGVFFRYFARKLARKLGIKGFARNEPDGTVLIQAVGESREINKFIEWCHKGSPAAYVERVEIEELAEDEGKKSGDDFFVY